MGNRVLTIKLVRVHVRLLHVYIVFLRTSLVSSSSEVDERGQRGCIIYGAVCQDIGDAEGLFVDFMTHGIAEAFSWPSRRSARFSTNPALGIQKFLTIQTKLWRPRKHALQSRVYFLLFLQTSFLPVFRQCDIPKADLYHFLRSNIPTRYFERCPIKWYVNNNLHTRYIRSAELSLDYTRTIWEIWGLLSLEEKLDDTLHFLHLFHIQYNISSNMPILSLSYQRLNLMHS